MRDVCSELGQAQLGFLGTEGVNPREEREARAMASEMKLIDGIE
jgi:hypothetical protein